MLQDELNDELTEMMQQMVPRGIPVGGAAQVHQRVARRARRRRVATALPVCLLLIGLGGLAVRYTGTQDDGPVAVATNPDQPASAAIAEPTPAPTAVPTAIPPTPLPPTATPIPVPTRLAVINVDWNASEDSPDLPSRWEFVLTPGAECGDVDEQRVIATTGPGDSIAGSGFSAEAEVADLPGCDYDVSLNNGGGWRLQDTPVAEEQADGSVSYDATMVPEGPSESAIETQVVNVTVEWSSDNDETAIVPFAFTVSFRSADCADDDLTVINTAGDPAGSATREASLDSPAGAGCVWQAELELDFEAGWIMAPGPNGETQSNSRTIVPQPADADITFVVVAAPPEEVSA